MIGKELLQTNLGKVIGNGRDTSVWHDDWLSDTSRLRPMGPPPIAATHMKVSDLLQEDGSWNIEKIELLVPERSTEIQSLKPSRRGGSDKTVWLGNASGSYSSKSGYHVARTLKSNKEEEQLEHQTVKWKNEVWNYKTTPKLKLFLWKIIQGALPVGENLARRGVLTDAKCSRCGEAETTSHLFFNCRFSQRVWRLLPTTRAPSSFSFDNFHLGMQNLNNLTCLPPLGITSGNIFPWICWYLWSARNKAMFENRFLTEKEIMTLAIQGAREWNKTQENVETEKKKKEHRPPNTLPPTATQIFSDAAWSQETNKAGLGWIIQKQNTILLQNSRGVQHVKTPLVAEAMALVEALQQASLMKLQHVWVHSDSQTLVDAINKGKPLLEIYGLLLDISMLALDFHMILFSKIDRKANAKADSIAKQALRGFVAENETIV